MYVCTYVRMYVCMHVCAVCAAVSICVCLCASACTPCRRSSKQRTGSQAAWTQARGHRLCRKVPTVYPSRPRCCTPTPVSPWSAKPSQYSQIFTMCDRLNRSCKPESLLRAKTPMPHSAPFLNNPNQHVPKVTYMYSMHSRLGVPTC